MPHYATTRGLLRLAQGKWDDTAGTTIRVGLLVGSTIDPDIDTAAEVANLDTVAGLLAVATECTASGYARQTVTRSAATEDDTNDRVNFDGNDVSFGAISAGQTINAVFWFIDGASDITRDLLSIDILGTTIPTNGSGISLPVNDYARLS